MMTGCAGGREAPDPAGPERALSKLLDGGFAPTTRRNQPVVDRRTLIWIAAASAAVLLFLTALSPPLPAQEPAVSLTLEEALALARQNNPGFRSQRNDRRPAEWQVREAYGAFLPSFQTSLGGNWTDGGTVNFGTFNVESSSQLVSAYSLTLSYALNGSTLFGLSSARANRDAVAARIRADAFNLESAVTQQYLASLRARDGVRVAEEQLERAEENHELVSARVRVGAALSTDGKQAEVDMGRAEVALLRARNLLRAETSRLMEQMGVLREDVLLESEFEIFEPEWSREALLGRALDLHPQLRSLEAQEEARKAQVRQAGSAYFPSLSASANWSGFAREFGNPDFLLAQERASAQSQMQSCEQLNQISAGLSQPLEGFPRDCSQLRLTASDERRLLEGNDVFPFDFQNQPLQISFGVSLPVFNGFSRERQKEQAEVALADARETRRAEELRLRTAVNQSYDDLLTAHQVVEIEERNLVVAREQLDLARERYRLGAANFLELQDAETSLATAERDYLNAVYDFHNALSALETAVGSRLLRDTAAGDAP